jgi:hypothetical protein
MHACLVSALLEPTHHVFIITGPKLKQASLTTSYLLLVSTLFVLNYKLFELFKIHNFYFVMKQKGNPTENIFK